MSVLRSHLGKADNNSLKKKLLDDISLEQERLDGLESGCSGGSESLRRLRKEIERLKDSMDTLPADGEGAVRAAGEMRDLRLAIRGAELDDAQRRSREEEIRGLFDALASENVAAYERELARLDAEFEKSASLAFDKRMLELKRIADRLMEMSELKDFARRADIGALTENKFTPPPARKGAAAKRTETEIQSSVSEIRDWADRIARMDASEGEKLRPILEKLSADTQFPDRLTRIRSRLKTTWGTLRERLASTEFFRESLREIAGIAGLTQATIKSPEGAELARRYEEMCRDERKFIERVDFMRLYEDIAKFAFEREREIADEYFVSKMKSALSEMGYELLPDESSAEINGGGDLSMRPGEVRYLDSPYDGYRVMIKADSGGALSARLVRVAVSEDEKNALGADQEQKDIEVGHKWCEDFDGFLAKMGELGLPLDVTVRLEPGESPLLEVVGSRPAKRGARRLNISAERALSASGDDNG
jgi:predicted nucleic acid-binding protein